jgi:integrase
MDRSRHEIVHVRAREGQRVATRKRRESFGKVRKLPSGRIQASYVGLDGIRYNAPHTFDNMTDARGWLSIQQGKLHAGTWSTSEANRAGLGTRAKTETLGEYATQWIATRVNRHGEPLLPRTRGEYERLLRGKIFEPLVTERLATLTPAMVRAWNAAQLASGHKTQAARAYGLLTSILNTAVQDHKIAENPCMIRGAQSAKTGKRVDPPTPDELQKILDNITPRYKAAVILAAWAGLRYGEMTELRRKDLTVTPDTVIVNVTRAVTKVTGQGFIVGKPKSEAGVRAIVLPPHVRSTVVEHLSKYTADFPDCLLFPAADGVTHLSQSTFGKHWIPARKVAKREDMPWHAMRHYGATRAALAGATLKELQERLGHSTVAAAMRYQHTAGRDAELAQRMSDLAMTSP